MTSWKHVGFAKHVWANRRPHRHGTTFKQSARAYARRTARRLVRRLDHGGC